jgi:hypothetical protein
VETALSASQDADRAGLVEGNGKFHVKRRAFISLLVGAAGAAALPDWRTPRPVIFLPPRRAMSLIVDYADYFASPNAWYIKTPIPDGIKLYNRSHPQSSYGMTDDGLTELNYLSLEELCIKIRELTVDRHVAFSIKPFNFPRRWPWHV